MNEGSKIENAEGNRLLGHCRRITSFFFWMASALLIGIVGLVLGGNFVSEDPTRGAILIEPVVDYLLPAYTVTGVLLLLFLCVGWTKLGRWERTRSALHVVVMMLLAIFWLS